MRVPLKLEFNHASIKKKLWLKPNREDCVLLGYLWLQYKKKKKANYQLYYFYAWHHFINKPSLPRLGRNSEKFRLLVLTSYSPFKHKIKLFHSLLPFGSFEKFQIAIYISSKCNLLLIYNLSCLYKWHGHRCIFPVLVINK